MIGRDDDLSRFRLSHRDLVACKIAVLPQNGRIGKAGRRLAHIGAHRADIIRPERMLRKGGQGARFPLAAVGAGARFLPFPSAGGSERLLPRAEEMPRFGQNALLFYAAPQTHRRKDALFHAGGGFDFLAHEVVPERGEHFRLAGNKPRLIGKARAALRARPMARKTRLGARRLDGRGVSDRMPVLRRSAASRKAEKAGSSQNISKAPSFHRHRSPSIKYLR